MPLRISSASGYDLYRNGALTALLGAVTSYTGYAGSPRTRHYHIQVPRDVAAMFLVLVPAASVTTPADTTGPIVVTLSLPRADGQLLPENIPAHDLPTNADADRADHLSTVIGSVGEGGPYDILWDSTTVLDGTVVLSPPQLLTHLRTPQARPVEV